MSDIDTGNTATAKVVEVKSFWDEAKLKTDHRDFERFLGIALGGTTGPFASNAADSVASNSKNPDGDSNTDSAAYPWKIFSPKNDQCGTWRNSPNKHRYASFGDEGTTASANCYGDLIQMSQHLNAGRSGLFTIDDPSVRQPYCVEIRSQDLENFSRMSGFGLYMPNESAPNEAEPPEVKWVNWRWPRYEYTYKTTRGTEVKACFQYMVRKGVVLQQFTLENTGDTSIPVGPFSFEPTHLIRDLDFLESDYTFNTHNDSSKEYHRTFGPNGYGHVCVHEGAQDLLAPSSSSNSHCELPTNRSSAVASAITIFVNGSATRNQRKHFLKRRDLGAKSSRDSKLQIVIAYKIFPIKEAQMPWTSFLVSAEDANINHWLREECKRLWGPNDDNTHCLTGLALSTVKVNEYTTEAADSENQATTKEKTAYAQSNAPYHEAPKDLTTTSFEMPRDTPTQWSNSMNHLDYFAWRHLEHILSVCAIPLCFPKGTHDKGSGPAIALTCGDMSGHRINTAASFFAFKFLIDVALRLRAVRLRRRESHVKKFLTVMEKRIVDTCSGHIRWLDLLQRGDEPEHSLVQVPPTEERLSNDYIMRTGCFAANYWITGNIMTEDSYTWQPENSMTDTALQILKIEEYKKLQITDSDWSTAQSLLDDLYIPWLTELNKLDIRGTFTWPHRKIENISTFRLDDHFWIWKALNFLHVQVPKISLPRRHAKSPRLSPAQSKWIRLLYLEKQFEEEGDKDRKLELRNEAIRDFMIVAKRLSPMHVQRGILQRFTTLEDASQQRMLAVSRSAGQTRFLLHARDIVLLYGEDDGFFSENSARQLWDNTKHAQLHHEENLNTEWEITLRYALGIAMGVRSYSLNASSATELVKTCVRVLISSSGSDAFFPGFLDELGNEPTNFGDERNRDFFYNAGFEIHYVLLSSANRLAERFRQESGSPKYNKGMRCLSTTSDQTEQCGQDGTSGLAFSAKRSSGRKATNERNELQQTLLMKRFCPFTNTILATNCNTFKDEWLYKYPDFLRSGRITLEAAKKFSQTVARGNDTGLVVARAIEKANLWDPASLRVNAVDRTHSPEQPGTNSPVQVRAKIVDREKKKHLGRGQKDVVEREEPRDRSNYQEILDDLGSPRSATNAKKRLISLCAVDLETVFVSWFVSPERERQFISKFFDRHARCDKDVLDRTSLVLNEWQTELHLSFYLLVENTAEGGTDLLSVPNRNSSIPFPGQGKQQIRRASMSFRFDGDFFDRYWTCHFLESIPGVENLNNEHVLLGLDGEDLLEARWQRKVLELYFLNQMLERIVQASRLFPTQVRKNLELGGPETKSLAMETLLEEKHAKSIMKWQEFERVLQLVEEDLSSVLSTVQKWNRREHDRGNEQPRWTQNDENKYRTTINKLHGQTQITTVGLEASRDALRNLREFLVASRKSAQADRDRKREERDSNRAARESLQNENIRYFTVITAIFLPLGFATSFYSMGGPPHGSLIVSLVEFAFAALTITFLLIVGLTLLIKKLEPKQNHDLLPGDPTSPGPEPRYSGKPQESGISCGLFRSKAWRMRKHAAGKEPDDNV